MSLLLRSLLLLSLLLLSLLLLSLFLLPKKVGGVGDRAGEVEATRGEQTLASPASWTQDTFGPGSPWWRGAWMGRLRPSRHCSWGGAGRTACPWYRGVQGRVEALIDLLGVDKAGNVPGLQLADVLLGQPVQVSCDVGGLPCLEGLSRSQ